MDSSFFFNKKEDLKSKLFLAARLIAGCRTTAFNLRSDKGAFIK